MTLFILPRQRNRRKIYRRTTASRPHPAPLAGWAQRLTGYPGGLSLRSQETRGVQRKPGARKGTVTSCESGTRSSRRGGNYCANDTVVNAFLTPIAFAVGAAVPFGVACVGYGAYALVSILVLLVALL